jgi:type I restriction enzyme S subunit
MKEGKQSTNLASLNLTKLSNFPVPLMPFEESQQISTMIGNYLQKIFVLIDILGQSLKKNEILDQSIITKAFKGELLPQNPLDEPAAVLLDRLKAIPVTR